MHVPSGTTGASVGLLTPPLLTLCIWLRNRTGSFLYDQKSEPGAFEPFLAKYIRAAEFVVGIATGSIVLLVGVSAFHGQGGRLPWTFASPLLLLAFSVIWAVAFMVWLIRDYSEYRHGQMQNAYAYSLTLALGYGAATCFGIGYLWLVVIVTR